MESDGSLRELAQRFLVGGEAHRETFDDRLDPVQTVEDGPYRVAGAARCASNASSCFGNDLRSVVRECHSVEAPPSLMGKAHL